MSEPCDEGPRLRSRPVRIRRARGSGDRCRPSELSAVAWPGASGRLANLSPMNDVVFAGTEALTFDDVLVVPGWSEVLPPDVDISTVVGGISLEVPLISAAMDTVTEAALAIALAREGGLGVLHRNLTIEEQTAQVDRVKRAQSGMITNPISLSPTSPARGCHR